MVGDLQACPSAGCCLEAVLDMKQLDVEVEQGS